MKGLILKDLLTVKDYRKSLLIFLAFFLVIALFNKEFAGLLPIVALLFATIIVNGSFSYDDYYKWERYAVTVPVTKKDIVKSKYALFVILIIIGAILGVGLGIGFQWLVNKQIDLESILSTIAGSGFIFILIYCVQYPIIFKYDVEKGRVALFLIVIILGTIGGGIFYLIKQTPGMLEKIIGFTNQGGWIVVPVFLILCVFLSYFTSRHFFEKKES